MHNYKGRKKNLMLKILEKAFISLTFQNPNIVRLLILNKNPHQMNRLIVSV